MLEWLQEHRELVGWLTTLGLVLGIGSIVLLPILIARVPADYFSSSGHGHLEWADRHPFVRIVARILKNTLGAILLLLGTAMLIGPGQGLLTVVAALVLLEFPGKRRLELKLVSHPRIFRGLNWIRARTGRPPFEPPV